ncbi:MAG: hypothetical protein U9P70_03645 [Patescibacteria group bacterium]|nr:hypothetical protein [Patescibacteria group bacterium]
MVYLAKFENGKTKETIITHEITIETVIEEGNHKYLEEFIEKKGEELEKIGFIKSIDFDDNIIKVVACVSKPHLFPVGMIVPYLSSSETIVVSSYLLRTVETIESETKLYLYYNIEFPEWIKVDRKSINVKVEQIFFPEKRESFLIILY